VAVVAKELGKAEENAEKLGWKETFTLFHAGQPMSVAALAVEPNKPNAALIWLAAVKRQAHLACA
jgi:heme/copper-type cytochrome/quinol oxidase subunit 3